MKLSRLLLTVLALLALALCASHVRAGQHGRHHGGNSGQRAQPAHPRGGSGNHAVPRDPGRYRQGSEARRPQAGVGRYDRYRYHNGSSRYYGPHRFPRSYGPRFYGSYRGYPFYPHHRYWNGRSWFYWPWYDRPLFGCRWYWLPGVRGPSSDLDEEGEPGWVYDGWDWVYLCID